MIKICNTHEEAQQVEQLFNHCFPDDEFNTWYFKNVFKSSQTLIFKDGDNVTSMLQMHDTQIVYGDKLCAATYIYGAATHENYRRKGQMARLLEKSFELDKKCGKKLSVLIPQEQWLFDFYKKYGYESLFYLTCEEFAVGDSIVSSLLSVNKGQGTKADATNKAKLQNNLSHIGFESAAYDDISEINCVYEKNLSGTNFVKRTEEYWKSQLKLSCETGYGFKIMRDSDGKVCSYASVYSSEESIFVHEIFALGANSSEIIEAFLNNLCRHYGVSKAKFSTFFEKEKNKPFACVKFYNSNGEDMPAKFYGYMNLLYN